MRRRRPSQTSSCPNDATRPSRGSVGSVELRGVGTTWAHSPSPSWARAFSRGGFGSRRLDSLVIRNPMGGHRLSRGGRCCQTECLEWNRARRPVGPVPPFHRAVRATDFRRCRCRQEYTSSTYRMRVMTRPLQPGYNKISQAQVAPITSSLLPGGNSITIGTNIRQAKGHDERPRTRSRRHRMGSSEVNYLEDLAFVRDGFIEGFSTYKRVWT